MLQSFFVVGTQVLILFILIGIGFIGAKKGIIQKEGVSTITEIMLYIVTPCVIIHAFQRDFEPKLLKGFLIAFGAALLSHAICIILGKLFIHNSDDDKNRLFRFGVIFSNCGFMSLPLLDALLGSEGVFYGASYVAVFNLVLWSYGVMIMDRTGSKLSIKKLLLNPGVIPVFVGLLFFFTSFKLPSIIATPVSYLAALNTPVPMLVIGYNVSGIDLKKAMRDKDEYIMMILRLLVCPVIVLGIMYGLGIRGTLLVACAVSASAPVAASSTMFTIKFGGNSELSAETVAVSTLLSIITMTLVVGSAFAIAY
jgi:hypothetical protein